MDSGLLAFIIFTVTVFLAGPVLLTVVVLLFFLSYPKDANDIIISDTRKDSLIDRLSDQDTKPSKRRRL